MALNWKKVPSVRTGGKAYFYVSFTPYGKRTVVWDRVEEKWALVGDQEPPRGEAPVLGLFATASAAMKFAEKGQKTMAFYEYRVYGRDAGTSKVPRYITFIEARDGKDALKKARRRLKGKTITSVRRSRRID